MLIIEHDAKILEAKRSVRFDGQVSTPLCI